MSVQHQSGVRLLGVGGGGVWQESRAERPGICTADDLMAVVSSQNKQALTVQGKR